MRLQSDGPLARRRAARGIALDAPPRLLAKAGAVALHLDHPLLGRGRRHEAQPPGGGGRHRGARPHRPRLRGAPQPRRGNPSQGEQRGSMARSGCALQPGAWVASPRRPGVAGGLWRHQEATSDMSRGLPVSTCCSCTHSPCIGTTRHVKRSHGALCSRLKRERTAANTTPSSRGARYLSLATTRKVTYRTSHRAAASTVHPVPRSRASSV